jgi:hypothetical protein
MKSFHLCFLVLLITAKNTHAQLNESDTVKFQLRTSVTGNYQQGNVEVLTLRSKLDFTFSPVRDFVFKSQNSSLYQAFYSTKADNDIFSRNYLYYKPQKKVYPFAITYISTNYRRKIDNRYFAGAGVTWQLINKANHVIKLSASVIYERSAFYTTVFNYTEYNGNKNIKLWRGTFYIGGWSYTAAKHIRLYYDAFYQPALNNKHNYRLQADIGLDFPVWKGLSFTALYTLTHENVVVKNIKQDDRILTFGLAYNFRALHSSR